MFLKKVLTGGNLTLYVSRHTCLLICIWNPPWLTKWSIFKETCCACLCCITCCKLSKSVISIAQIYIYYKWKLKNPYIWLKEPYKTNCPHIQSVPPKWGQLRDQFFFFRKHICLKIRPVLKFLWKIFQMAPWNLGKPNWKYF